MLTFVLASENLPFTIALALMLGIALLEGVTTILGAALSSVVDTVLPERLAIDPDIDVAGADAHAPNALTRVLGWLRVGELPLLIVLVVFLTLFGLVGLALQSATWQLLGHAWPATVASIIVSPAALAATRAACGGLARIMPRDETEAVSVDTLVGRIATITIGTARPGRPAEGRVLDAFGTMHYVMLEPDLPGESFGAGEEILLVRRRGSIFTGIRNPHPALAERAANH